MGKAIEKIAVERGHIIVAKIDKDNENESYMADVAINFSVPSAAYKNISDALKRNPCHLWHNRLARSVGDIESLCKENNGAFICMLLTLAWV